MDELDVVRSVRSLLEPHPAVRNVTLSGSRARGDATTWSDWDFSVVTDDFASLAADLQALVEPLRPLATLWDPLADHQTFMLILDGPVKVDLIVDEPHAPKPPYVLTPEALPAIDSHFWDWTLWLTSKVAHGKDDLVRSELEKMTWYLLDPLGVTTTPQSLTHAADLYLEARTEHERRFQLRVPRDLGEQVVRRIRDQASPG